MDEESVELSKFSNPEEEAFRELHGNDDIGVTALMYAATQRDATSLLEMLASGYAEASLFVKDKKGRTALDWARISRNELAIAVLSKAIQKSLQSARNNLINADADAEVRARDSNRLQSEMLLKSLHARDEDASMLALTENAEGRTESHYNSNGGVVFRDVVESFGETYFTDIPDSLGTTPLMLASGRNMLSIVFQLIDMGAPLDASNKHGHNPLVWSCICGHTEIIKALLLKGANINHKTAEGRTPLHYCCLYAKPKAAEVLFNFLFEKFQTFRLDHPRKKADPSRWSKYAVILENFCNVKDNYGKKPIELIPEKLRSDDVQKFAQISAGMSVGSLSPSNAISSAASFEGKLSLSGHLTEEELRDDILPVPPICGSNRVTSTKSNIPGSPGALEHVDAMSAISLERSAFDDGESASIDDQTMGDHSFGVIDMSGGHGRSISPSLITLDTDNFLSGLHGLNDAHSMLSVMTGTEDILSLEEVFMKTEERICQWKLATVKETEFAAKCLCWNECGYSGRFEDLMIHLKKSCPKRLLKCPECADCIHANVLKEHRHSKCLHRLCACPNTVAGCTEILRYYNLNRHTKLRCKLRLVNCRLHCGAMIPLRDLLDHEGIHCCKRLIECGICEDKIVSEKIAHHRHKECLNRLVKCRVSCGERMLAKDLEFHENEVCISLCSWGCGEKIGPLARRTYHELHLCELRPRICSHGCGIKGLTAKFQIEHEKNQCFLAPILCPNNCGNTVLRGELYMHTSNYGNCPERFVGCPSNVVGWRILYSKCNSTDENSSEPGIVLKYERQISTISLKTSSLDASGKDRLFVRFKNRHEWIEYWDSKIVLTEKLNRDAYIECPLMPYSILNNHLKCFCMNRPVAVATDIEEKQADMLTLSTCVLEEQGHIESKSEMPLHTIAKGQIIDYRHAQGLALKRVELDNFLNKPSTDVNCPHCGSLTKAEELETHVKSECRKLYQRCIIGCGAKILIPEMAEHVEKYCPKREVCCMMCTQPIWAEEMEEHLARFCLERNEECPNRCNKPEIKFRDLEHHMIYECHNRQIICTCGEVMLSREREDHIIADCPKKLGLCPQGCGMMVPRDEIQLHMIKTCTNKDSWGRQYINCPARCGTRMMRKDFLEHISYACKYRLSECPLNCGNYLKFDKIQLHIYFCPMRPVCCQPGMKSCERVFNRWFYPLEGIIDESMLLSGSLSMEKSGSLEDREKTQLNSHIETSSSVVTIEGKVYMKDDIRMRPCVRHRSSILMYAIKAKELVMAEYIIKATNKRDLDIENSFGHTALTIAAKMGLLQFVELLVQSGANFCIETSTGNTPLIEAVKSGSLDVVEYLAKAGALVRYKTYKHRKSSMDWAKVLGYKMIERSLDIHAVVQAQIVEIFKYIAKGDTDKVRALVEPGDFFKPTNASELSTKLHLLFVDKDKAEEDSILLEKLLRDQDEIVRVEQGKYDELVEEVNKNEKQVQEIAADVVKYETKVHNAFHKFEDLAATFLRSDFEELTRMSRPSVTVCLAVQIFGIMYNILDADPRSVYDTNIGSSSFKDWWKSVMKVMVNSSDTMKRMKGFSLAKLSGPIGNTLLLRAREVYQQLKKAVEKQDLPVSSVVSLVSSGEEELKGEKEVDLGPVSSRSELKDEDWDSDADDAGGGSWVKGEWVPIIKKKEKWWDRDSRRIANEILASEKEKLSIPSEEVKGFPSRVKYDIVVLDPDFQPAATVHFSDSRNLEPMTDPSLCPHFVQAMMQLVESAEAYAAAQPLFADARLQTMKLQQLNNESKALMKEQRKFLESEKYNRQDLETKLIENIRLNRHLLKQISLFREKVRVARLLNHMTPNGHTAISWAASYGNFSAVEDLLSHGAPVGYNEDLVNLSVSVIQLSYRIYKFIHTAKTKLSNEDQLNKQLEAGNIQLIEEIVRVKHSRGVILDQLRWRRKIFRLPLVEAAYNGKWEIVRRIYDRRLFSVKFSEAWSYPKPHPPFKSRETKLDGKISILEVLAYGTSDLAAGEYQPTQGGWAQAGAYDSHGEAFVQISEVVRLVKELGNEAFRNARHRKRILRIEAENQEEGAKEITDAIIFYDFRKCIWLAENRSISIDTEINDPGSNQDGETALLKASEENAGAVNHKLMVNVDGRSVLQVSFLLDRPVHRPSVNQENKFGVTALMRACEKGRPYVVQALLDRGADANFINKFGQTALHFAVEVGNTECIRILLERGIDVHKVDKNGRTAYDIANDKGFTMAMSQMSKHSGGNWGRLAPSRGNVNDKITCLNGCGKFIFSYDFIEHNAVCRLREVVCENGCGMARLLFKDLEEHMAEECTHRRTTCTLCSKSMPLCYIPSHERDKCDNRTLPCGLGCDMKVRAIDMDRHLLTCFARPVLCSLGCGESMKVGAELFHVKNLCELRRVECPLNCSAKVVANKLMSHITELCPRRPVECKFCQLSMKFTELKLHVRKCELREEQCKCGQQVPYKELDHHYKTSCANRFADCTLKCGLKVRISDMQNHLEKFCGNRLVPCPFGCVSSTSLDNEVTMLCFRTVDAHVSHSCIKRPVHCALCSQLVPLPEMEYHREILCTQKMVQCRMPKCAKKLPIVERDDHERFKCRFRQVICPQGCGERILALYTGKHVTQICVERMCECSLKCGVKNLRYKYLDEHLKDECIRRHVKIDTSPPRSPAKTSRAVSPEVRESPSRSSSKQSTRNKSPPLKK